MSSAWLLWALLLWPLLAAVLCWRLKSPRAILGVVAGGGAAWAVLAGLAAAVVWRTGPLTTAGTWLRLDALAAYHVAILGLVFGAASVYTWGYFADELAAGQLGRRQARRFGALWFGAATAMTSVLLSNNLGLMWVGIETTTLTTAFLICVHVSPLSLEAMWKYLVVCSVGVAFAFVGTLLVGASAQQLGLDAADMLLWTKLSAASGSLAPGSMKLAFIFLLVGYGTKAGLAPLHSWLPDAHSQAPAPVSALFSGFMLSTAMYCLMRYLPLVEGATGNVGWGRDLLLLFGLVSILVAAAFIVFQRDGKRLLAYSSVEHLGIVALGLGLGGLGTFAALWHTLNHALGKSLAFFSIGRLGQLYGTHDLHQLAGACRRAPWWGGGFLGGVLVLIGVAPFAIFMSEFQILRAAVAAHAFVSAALFLLGAAIVFVAALRLALVAAWGDEVTPPRRRQPASLADRLLLLAGFGLLLLLGVWLPAPLQTLLTAAARVIGGQP